MFILFAGGSVVVETLSGFNRVVLKVVLSILLYHYIHCPKQTIKTLPPFLILYVYVQIAVYLYNYYFVTVSKSSCVLLFALLRLVINSYLSHTWNTVYIWLQN